MSLAAVSVSISNVSEAVGMVVDMVTLYSSHVLSCMCEEDKCATCSYMICDRIPFLDLLRQ